MITQLINALKARITAASAPSGRLSMLRSVLYGPFPSVATPVQPALVFNFLGSNAVYGQSSFRTLEVRFGLFLCNSVTATVEQAAVDAQNLYWFYAEDAPIDRGLIPWSIELSRDRFFTDSQGRQWRFKLDNKKNVKIYSDMIGQNVRGAVYAEAVLFTGLDKLT